MSLVTKLFINNNRLVQIGDTVTIIGNGWIGPDDQDYRGRSFTIVEDAEEIRFVNPSAGTIRIGGVLRHPEDFE